MSASGAPRTWRRPRLGTVATVRDFWEAESCGERYQGPGDSRFAVADATRYRLEPQIAPFAQFDRPFAGRALEVGTGMGADFQRNVARGGSWVAFDLTSRALAHVRERVGPSAPAVQGDAQVLPFRDGTFDLVYSWGVLMHCPRVGAGVAEIHRVLRPGGGARLMLYHSPSWVSLAAWFRWGWYRGLSLRQSVSYLESPGTQAFTVAQASRLLSVFDRVSVRPVRTSWDTRWWGPIGRLGGDSMGWFLLCEAVK